MKTRRKTDRGTPWPFGVLLAFILLNQTYNFFNLETFSIVGGGLFSMNGLVVVLFAVLFIFSIVYTIKLYRQPKFDPTASHEATKLKPKSEYDIDPEDYKL